MRKISGFSSNLWNWWTWEHLDANISFRVFTFIYQSLYFQTAINFLSKPWKQRFCLMTYLTCFLATERTKMLTAAVIQLKTQICCFNQEQTKAHKLLLEYGNLSQHLQVFIPFWPRSLQRLRLVTRQDLATLNIWKSTGQLLLCNGRSLTTTKILQRYNT